MPRWPYRRQHLLKQRLSRQVTASRKDVRPVGQELVVVLHALRADNALEPRVRLEHRLEEKLATPSRTDVHCQHQVPVVRYHSWRIEDAAPYPEHDLIIALGRRALERVLLFDLRFSWCKLAATRHREVHIPSAVPPLILFQRAVYHLRCERVDRILTRVTRGTCRTTQSVLETHRTRAKAFAMPRCRLATRGVTLPPGDQRPKSFWLVCSSRGQ